MNKKHSDWSDNESLSSVAKIFSTLSRIDCAHSVKNSERAGSKGKSGPNECSVRDTNEHKTLFI